VVRSPTLDELPAPPAGKTGWPWTVETPPLATASPDGKQWPRISIITPSFNQAQFIEETIRSVLLQGYSDLEYLIIDGGSTDGSLDIIRKYEKWITHWVSEPDHGQADAIQKGLNRVSGCISAYLNSDDVYMQGAVQRVASRFARQPDLDVVYGNLYRIDACDKVLEEHRNTPFMRWGYLYGGFFLHQPCTFWKTDVVRGVGGFNPEFRFDMDNDLFVRIAMTRARFAFERAFLAGFRVHETSKTSTILHVSREENDRIREKYLPFPFNSAGGTLIRSVSFARRLCWYTVQGDLGWLARRAFSRTSRMRGA
jgi:glycosyltransferase involved in cell wall biosynthesis